MNRVWEISKFHPKPSWSTFKANVMQGHEVKERSNCEVSGLDDSMHSFGQFFCEQHEILS